MSIFRCLICNTVLDWPIEQTCLTCSKTYNPIAGIPLFVRNKTAYIAAMINNCFQIRRIKVNEIQKLHDEIAHSFFRKPVLMRLIGALEENNVILDELISELDKVNIPAIDLMNAYHPLEGIIHFKDFQYLKRDWCWLPEGESQINTIVSALQVIIKQYIPNHNNTLFLGSGLGRLVFELSSSFEQVYATDLSFSMMFFFQNILHHKNIPFNEINYSNTLSDNNVTRKLTATIGKLKENVLTPGSLENLHYFIADATDLPIVSDTLFSIFSIYFTDVIALNLIMPEIVRTLKPGGVFVHFGPLGYNFENTADKLSANEIKSRFELNGFDIVYENLISSNHLDSDYSLQSVQLSNWIFVARKKEYKELTVDLHTVLKLADGISYEITGTLYSYNQESKSFKVWTSEGTCYVLTEISYDTIAEISSGSITIEDLVELMRDSYTIDDVGQYIEMLKDLSQKKILEIVS